MTRTRSRPVRSNPGISTGIPPDAPSAASLRASTSRSARSLPSLAATPPARRANAAARRPTVHSRKRPETSAAGGPTATRRCAMSLPLAQRRRRRTAPPHGSATSALLPRHCPYDLDVHRSALQRLGSRDGGPLQLRHPPRTRLSVADPAMMRAAPPLLHRARRRFRPIAAQCVRLTRLLGGVRRHLGRRDQRGENEGGGGGGGGENVT